MSRATCVYVGMIVALVLGIFIILRAGRHLHAPTDLSGTWQLEPTLTGAAQSMTVVQSGQFVTIHLDSSRRLDLRVTAPDPDPQSGTIRMTDGQWTVTFHAEEPEDRRLLTLSGPMGIARYDARRVARPFAEAIPEPSENAVAADAQ